MRGRIIQYNSNDGVGLISFNGTQFDFTIRHWTGDTVPLINHIADIELDGDRVKKIGPVSSEVLIREKATAFKSKIIENTGIFISSDKIEAGRKILSSIGRSTAEIKAKFFDNSDAIMNSERGDTGKIYLSSLDKPVGIAYLIFFIGSLLFNFATIRMFGMGEGYSLYNSIDILSKQGVGSYQLLLFMAYLSFLIPLFFKQRIASIAYLCPLSFLILLGVQIYHLYAGINSDFLNFDDIFSMIKLGLGFYACFISALFAGFTGIKKSVFN